MFRLLIYQHVSHLTEVVSLTVLEISMVSMTRKKNTYFDLIYKKQSDNIYISSRKWVEIRRLFRINRVLKYKSIRKIINKYIQVYNIISIYYLRIIKQKLLQFVLN